jgi:hypothetical protein
MNLQNFNDWQLANVQNLGFKNIPLDTKIAARFDKIDEMFGIDILAKTVNPLSDEDNSTMGFAFYEWLAEAGYHIKDKCESLMYAARCFSWQYPQLKMVCHEVRLVKPDPFDEHFLDNVEFVIEFLS